MSRNTKRPLLVLLIGSILTGGCGGDVNEFARDYKQDMRDFIQDISAYAKGDNPSFVIIPQNGQELLTENEENTAAPTAAYIDAIDAVGREDLFYGYNGDNIPTPISERDYMIAFLDIAEECGVEALVIDYCSSRAFVDSSYAWNRAKNYISYAANHRELDNIPVYPENPFNVNTRNIISLGEAKNFLYLINPSSYDTRTAFLNAIKNTNYDILIIDAFFGAEQLSQSEIANLKIKENGGTRLVIAYMSIGEAENYRYYWQTEWKTDPPSWLAGENPNWPGNYKVRYWETDWQDIINGYLQKILDAGFDGVYLDIIDAFEYFES